MTGTPSLFVDLRNAVEAIADPEISAAVSFAQAVKNNSAASASGNIASAFGAAETAFTGGLAGGLEAAGIAAVTAFLSTLLGEEFSIVKTAAAPAPTAS